MKIFKLRKIMMLFALIIVIQNGAIIMQSAGNDSYSEEELIAPCSDFPCQDGHYN